DFSRYFTTTAQKCYIVQAQCTIARSGEYILTLGKTGYTEIYVNGRRLGLNTDTHGFFPVQYLSRIVLSRGTHTITVKTAPGDASHRLSLALLPDSSVYSTVPGDTVSRIDALYDPQTDEEVFNTAFLMNAAGLDGYDMAYRYFSSIPETSPYYYPSLYYRHRDSTSSSDKIDLLQRMHAIKPSPRVSHELSMLYASFGSFYQAFSHASKVEQHNRLASALLYTSLYSKTGWTDLALTETSRISSALPDTSSAHSARLYRSLDNHARAFRLYESLVDRYPRNAELLFIYCDYLEKQSSHDRLEELLYRSIHLFPELVNLRLRLGRSLYEQGKPDEAITVLSSVSRKMPYHPELLYLFSRCYMKKGNRNLAELYADRAGTLDPENRTISFYIDNTFSSKPRLASYTREFDIDALAAESDRYADEPAVMLYSETIEKLQTDGSSLKRVRKAFKIHDSDNCRGLSNLQIVLNAQTESILSLDFSVRAGDRRYISQQTRRQSLSDPESRLYYDIELVTAQLPLFEDDCIITSDYTISSSEGVEYKGYFGSRTYFPTDYRILEAYDTVITPRDTRLSWGLQHIDPAAHSVSLSAGERRYVTHIHSQAPVIREENAVPYFNRVPAVTYSTFSTWDEFHSWYSSLLSDRVIVTAPMKKAVRTLLAGSEKPEEKISALYSFITDRTRYVGFEIGIGGIQPRSTKETYQTGLGDCKDIALLLAALLREAGFNAELALVRTYNKGWADRQIPYVGNFNHAICFVDHDDGLFLDGTVNKASIHDLPLSDRNAEALIIRKDGYAFRTIEPEAYTPGTDEVSNDVTLKEDGSATLVRRLVKRGPIAVYFRNDYTTDDKKIRYLARYWNSVYPGSVISDYTVSGLESTGAVSYSYTIDIPSFFDPADDTVTIPGFIMPVRYTAQIAPQSTRHGPLFMDSAHETRLSTTVHIPEGFSVTEDSAEKK
ncbi:MAG: tetratricopeptide repeat protein, partial [Spirochaetota bacterium]